MEGVSQLAVLNAKCYEALKTDKPANFLVNTAGMAMEDSHLYLRNNRT